MSPRQGPAGGNDGAPTSDVALTPAGTPGWGSRGGGGGSEGVLPHMHASSSAADASAHAADAWPHDGASSDGSGNGVGDDEATALLPVSADILGSGRSAGRTAGSRGRGGGGSSGRGGSGTTAATNEHHRSPQGLLREHGARGGAPEVAEQLGLLQHHDVTPTSNRLVAGLFDLAMLAMAALPFVVVRALRWLLARLGVPEHSWRAAHTEEPLSVSDRQQLSDAVAALAAGKLPGSFPAVPPARTGDGTPPLPPPLRTGAGPALRALAYVSAIACALEDACCEAGLPCTPEEQAAVRRTLVGALSRFARANCIDPLDALKAARHAGKSAVRALAGARGRARGGLGILRRTLKDEFVFRSLMRVADAQPTTLTRVALKLPEGAALVEEVELTPLAPGLAYVRAAGKRFATQAGFMASFQRFRPSDAKREPEVQAMSINARTHRLLLRDADGASRVIAWYPRCGAFAVHTKPPRGRRMGLAALVALAAEVRDAHGRGSGGAAHAARLLRHARLRSEEELSEEIEARRVCCVAQALPVLVESLRTLAACPDSLDAALRAGAFLFVQHSLLSDLNVRERSYLQDLVGALDELCTATTVRFSPRLATGAAPEVSVMTGDVIGGGGSGALHVEITLPSPPPEVLSRLPGGGADGLPSSLRVRAAVFSTGVNVLQSLGFLVPPPPGTLPAAAAPPPLPRVAARPGKKARALSYGDALNAAALRCLNEYAVAAGRAGGRALADLNAHFSPLGVRYPKDAAAVGLVRDVARELGGCRAVNCKSGKDRTGVELALAMCEEAKRQLPLSAAQATALADSLVGGLSFQVTGQNCAQPAAYAFTEFELVTLPPGWAPNWRLCGKART